MQADKVNDYLHYSSMATTGQRRVAGAMKAGGADVGAIETEDLVPFQADEVLLQVEAVAENGGARSDDGGLMSRSTAIGVSQSIPIRRSRIGLIALGGLQVALAALFVLAGG